MLPIKEVSSILKNKDFLNTLVNQSWAVIAGPLALIFIPLFLTQQLQGYYYAFISISALSILADLGFSNIILQFAAHEFAFLKHSDHKISFEDPQEEIHLKKLASLFKFSVKWTLTIIIIAYPVIFIIGFFLFRQNNDDVMWIIPWIIFSAGSAVSFLNSSVLALFEGCNMVARVQRIRFYNAFIFSMVVLTGLAFGFKLYSLAYAGMASALFTGIFIVISFRPLILQFMRYSRDYSYKWRGEIMNLFWKYVISFSSGYFIYQIYTPLTFRFHGAEEAGRVGFSLALWAAVLSVANIWVVSVLPRINMLVATKKWKDLDQLVIRRFFAGESTLIVVGLLFFAVYFLISAYFPIAERFSSVNNLVILFGVWILQFGISMMAVYLRAHKEEPFYRTYFFSAVYIVIVTYVCTRLFTADYIFTGLSTASVVFLPWYLYIFNRRRKIWHR